MHVLYIIITSDLWHECRHEQGLGEDLRRAIPVFVPWAYILRAKAMDTVMDTVREHIETWPYSCPALDGLRRGVGRERKKEGKGKKGVGFVGKIHRQFFFSACYGLAIDYR